MSPRLRRGCARMLRCGVLLALLAALLGACAAIRGPEAAPSDPVILVSLDGFRPADLRRGLTPALDRLLIEGAHAASMQPSFPSLTFPNHYTLVTGLRPDRNGVIHNTMTDPDLPGQRFATSNRAAVQDARWWAQAEPIWTRVQRSGRRAATMYWPGSEAPVHGAYPDDWAAFDPEVTPEQRVDTVLGWLDRPAARRPVFISLYFEHVDKAAHHDGPDSPQAAAAVRRVDAAIARLVAGIAARGLDDRVHLLIVSDHGMATVVPGQVTYLEDLIDEADADIVTTGVLAGLRPQPGRSAAVERALLGRHAHMECWRKQALPARFRYGTHRRVPPLLCLADEGWVVSTRARMAALAHVSRGEHGYDPALPSMQAIFIARGPAFVPGAQVPPIDNVDVYPLLAHLLGLVPGPHDGSLQPLRPLLKPDRAPPPVAPVQPLPLR
ncbi:MAG TPA: ectonucleotide pyrophosphatase/phosphodiesterase [Dokdonella sp.]|uniref:alkaline phosphatase family protein n=1 Tax=Dokdonella sp. TaxID=2291710 RepID=UPI002BB6324D|nr:ectonucleotide pyrophosphatase/phosphodiesterase [Dokdonella sp.]HUD42014.1 ectonucleotide pyrophosphatase/phosphodiesterase [Dokdonella sp.]